MTIIDTNPAVHGEITLTENLRKRILIYLKYTNKYAFDIDDDLLIQQYIEGQKLIWETYAQDFLCANPDATYEEVRENVDFDLFDDVYFYFDNTPRYLHLI